MSVGGMKKVSRADVDNVTRVDAGDCVRHYVCSQMPRVRFNARKDSQ